MKKICFFIIALFIHSTVFAGLNGEGSKVHPNMILLLRQANLSEDEIFVDAIEVTVASAQAKGFRRTSQEGQDPITMEKGSLRGLLGNGQRLAIYKSGRRSLGTFAQNKALDAQFIQIIDLLENGTVKNNIQRYPY